jgi:hypothetical protein
MIQADIYFLSLLLRSYEGQTLRFHLSNESELVGIIGKLTGNRGAIEITSEPTIRRFVPLCKITAVDSTNGVPLVLPHRSSKLYAKVASELDSCTQAINDKAFQLWRSQALIGIFVPGEVSRNVRISDIVPGLISIVNSVFVTSEVIEIYENLTV